MKRALVCQTRVPEVDRDSGSQQVDLYIQWLREAGWSVSFAAAVQDGDQHHAHRLRQSGVATFLGYEEAEEAIAAGGFDLAVLAFWEVASRLLPAFRRASPDTRVIVDSVDLHFLREARRVLGAGICLDESFGSRFTGELNTYRGADAVLAVSAREADLLASFIGSDRTYELPIAKTLTRSPVPYEERKGMFFVGNFRHLPNAEAVEYLCREILPQLQPELLDAHPLSVVGSRLDDKIRAHARGLSAVKMIGWVPSIVPYLERTRVCVVPLLHGAGVKGKIVESLLTGTPVVTTPIGAEGLDLRPGEHAVIAETPDEFAAGLTQLLTDADRWQRLADAGHELLDAKHAPEQVREQFLKIVEHVCSLPVREELGGSRLSGHHRSGRGWRELAYRETVSAIEATLAAITEPGSSVVVVSRGDDRLGAVGGRQAWHFPQDSDGRWAGYHPSDSASAIRELEALRERGAGYFVVPSSSFWWLHHYRELFDHLDARHRRIHSSPHAVVFDLGEPSEAEEAGPKRVLVLGTHDEELSGPPEELVAELDGSQQFSVAQRWQPAPRGDDHGLAANPPADADADWLLYVRDDAVLPAGFVDEFLAVAEALARFGVERVQPAHDDGPDAGPPVTERIRGVLARELEAATALPVLAVRRGAATEGSVAILDSVRISLRAPLGEVSDPATSSTVRDVFLGDPEAPRRAVQRSQWSPEPLLSVLIATHDRPDLLAECLEGFCEQTLPVDDFEVVVVDDGSAGPRTGSVLREYAPRLPLTWVRIDKSGRSAAKNLALLLARGELVLFFDDDDIPAPEMLQEHLRAHRLHPDESTAILGHTDWAPELKVSPLMHYLTEVDSMLFSYGHLEDGKRLGWRGFWEGRISSKRALHLRHGLHDQRLAYSIDIEMGWRLARDELTVIYHAAARSFMARPIDFEDFCRRREEKGRAQAAIAQLHDDPELHKYLGVEGAAERWHKVRPKVEEIRSRIAELERELGGEAAAAQQDDARLEELHRAYRMAFEAYSAKGIAEELGGVASDAASVSVSENGRGVTHPASDEAEPVIEPGREHGSDNGGEPPAVTVTMPVWSRTPELAEMATRTIDRVWEVARMPTEVVVVDNGSPEQHPGMRARIFRSEENMGVASGWNKGIELARAPVIAVLNSDCRVEAGWDEALYEAVTTGRRIAFPYTDHCDGRGFRQPDQAGTAGWCFMLARAVIEEVGLFDERFNPAYVEDTDYWHRAWKLGIELSPVPAARVTHARRTSADNRSDWLLTGHRFLYGWKHGVEPMRAPPFYKREIVEYHCQGSERSALMT
jgi:GT2 family glycosyltransferase/glycosyltransferase involved in cell wall biosynthesis